LRIFVFLIYVNLIKRIIMKDFFQKIRCKFGCHIWFYYELRGAENRICYHCMTRHQKENNRWILK